MEYRGRGGSHYRAARSGRDTYARRSLPPSPPEKERPRGRPFGALSEQKLRSQLSEWRSTTGKPGGETTLRKRQLQRETEAYGTNIEQRRTKAEKALAAGKGGASLENVGPLRRIADSLTIPLGPRWQTRRSTTSYSVGWRHGYTRPWEVGSRPRARLCSGCRSARSCCPIRPGWRAYRGAHHRAGHGAMPT